MNTSFFKIARQAAFLAFLTPALLHATPESEVEAKLNGATLLTASTDVLTSGITEATAATPKAAPGYVRITLLSRTDADAIAPQVVRAAIIGLGSDPSIRLIGGIVYEAVKVTPDAVIEIVRAAVATAPREAAQEIVAAAVSAVPDPYKEVTYSKATAVTSDYKDFKDHKDYKNPVGERMPLAEAICREAGVDVAYADSVLKYGVTNMYYAVSSAKGIAGVGEVGKSNYANEPNKKVKDASSPKKPTPKPTPEPDETPSPVSQ